MLDRPLTARTAVQIALLKNRRLQALYEELGVAQAELVRAGLLKNPLFEGALRFVHDRHEEVLELALVEDFVSLFMIPLKKGVAEAELEAAKLRVTSSVFDLAHQVLLAYYRYQAAKQTLELKRIALQAAEASFEMAVRLHRAGNIHDLGLSVERAMYERYKLDLAGAELDVLAGKENLTALMGLWGHETRWSSVPRLPEMPEQEIDVKDLERKAVEKSLDLDHLRRRYAAAARRLQILEVTSFMPEAEAGVAAEREGDGVWSVGPAITMPMPLFDQGQAARAIGHGELRGIWEEYTALAVELRSASRIAAYRLHLARQQARYYQNILIPLQKKITRESQLRYNAMQTGVFDLLKAKRMETEAEIRQVEALLGYWISRAEVEQLLRGRLVKSARTVTMEKREVPLPMGAGNNH